MTRPVLLVTGARRGIGLAFAEAFAEGGYDIAFTDVVDDEPSTMRSWPSARPAARRCFFQNDVADLASHPGPGRRVLKSFGRIDCFVNNAGSRRRVRGDLLELEPDNFDRVLGVNLRGAVFLSQVVHAPC